MIITSKEIEKFEIQVLTDKKGYLESCSDNYGLYIEIAQKCFPAVYDKIRKIDLEKSPFENYILKSQELKLAGETEKEILVLKEAIENEIYIPGIYERLAIIYSKKKQFNLAYNVCNTWFKTNYWKLPNMASTTKRLLIRKEKLEVKIK